MQPSREVVFTELAQHHSVAMLEDDIEFAQSLRDKLEGEGKFAVTHFVDGKACLEGLRGRTFDLCLFDWHLPDMSGPQVMEQLRQGGCMPPVIFLTAFDAPEMMVQVLQSGADDYVVKPPAYPVLQARMQALLRRSLARGEVTVEPEQVGRYWVDYVRRQVHKDGQPVHLTPKELSLALHFLENRGKLLTRSCLYAVLGVQELAFDTRRLDVHISHLRHKLGWVADQGWRLASVHQQGYRLEQLEQAT